MADPKVPDPITAFDMVKKAEEAAKTWQTITAGGSAGAMVVGALVLTSTFGIRELEIGSAPRHQLSTGEFTAGALVGLVLVLAGLVAAVTQQIIFQKMHHSAYALHLSATTDKHRTSVAAVGEAAKENKPAVPPEVGKVI